MQQAFHLIADDRGLIAISGDDRTTFLQGLVSNDVSRVSADRAVYAALLTPQGRYLARLLHRGDRRRFLPRLRGVAARRSAPPAIDLSAALQGGARRRDRRLRRRAPLWRRPHGTARSAVTSPERRSHGRAVSSMSIRGCPSWARGRSCRGPMLARSWPGRAWCPATQPPMTGCACRSAFPTAAAICRSRRRILLENGFDELHGIDWQKGCYMGQELTARTRYRGLVRKRLLPVEVDGPLPAPGTPVMVGDKEAGEMRSGLDGLGLALLRLEYLDKPAAKACAAATAASDRTGPPGPISRIPVVACPIRERSPHRRRYLSSGFPASTTAVGQGGPVRKPGRSHQLPR